MNWDYHFHKRTIFYKWALWLWIFFIFASYSTELGSFATFSEWWYKPEPWTLIYPLNNLAWHLRLSFMTKFLSAAMRMMVNPWIASNEKLKKATGYQFQYDTIRCFWGFCGCCVEVYA